jgi:hypothetical protein
MGGGRQKHVSALIVAVVIRPPEAGKPQADLKTTNQPLVDLAVLGYQNAQLFVMILIGLGLNHGLSGFPTVF